MRKSLLNFIVCPSCKENLTLKIFKENDEVALRHQLQHLLENPAERMRLGRQGRQRVLECYTMASVAQQTMAVYQKLLKKRNDEL